MRPENAPARKRELGEVVPVVAFLCLAGVAAAQTQPAALQLKLDPAQSAVEFTLGASFHTVHGEFKVKAGSVQFNPSNNAIEGEIKADAASGRTGNDGRDRRMHQEILETARFPEIVFRPEHVEGKVAPHGVSNVQVSGLFFLHGSEHKLTVPVQVEISPDHWSVNAKFAVPYVEWGVKNPSNLFLHVSSTVGVSIHLSGTIP